MQLLQPFPDKGLSLTDVSKRKSLSRKIHCQTKVKRNISRQGERLPFEPAAVAAYENPRIHGVRKKPLHFRVYGSCRLVFMPPRPYFSMSIEVHKWLHESLLPDRTESRLHSCASIAITRCTSVSHYISRYQLSASKNIYKAKFAIPSYSQSPVPLTAPSLAVPSYTAPRRLHAP